MDKTRRKATIGGNAGKENDIRKKGLLYTYLTEGHSRIEGLELLPHRVLVEQISTHVALGRTGIASWFLGHDEIIKVLALF